MEQKSKNAVSIIGGADGSTSFFIVGHSKKQPLKIRIKNSIYRYKRKKVEKTIVANPHSLSETVQYAKEKYELTEIAPADREYIEQIKCQKERLIFFHLYKIGIDDDFLEMEIDYTWNIFEMSYSGNKKVMKRFKKIARDLYSYYGVTEEDIRNKTKRYSSLVTNLSS
ncbi:hypothetical protein [Eshraghiella crossota]